MINNNRQQNGRRRGRGGQRQGGGGNQGNGSRIDNRARGNAAQLLEKYKSLASDAQRQGDRVNTEYYLQFADHYFRVVSEQRGRFEEQDRQRQGGQGQFEDEDDFDGEEGDGREAQPYQRDGNRDNGRDRENGRDGNRDSQRDTGRNAEQAREPRRFDNDRNGERNAERDGNRDRNDQPRRERFQRDRNDGPVEGVVATEGDAVAASNEAPRPRRGRAPAREAAPVDTLDAALLPPSFAPANDGGDAPEADDAGEAKPRRRRLRPAGEASQAG